MHDGWDSLRAKVLGAEQQPRRGVGGGSEQRPLNVGIEAGDAQGHDGPRQIFPPHAPSRVDDVARQDAIRAQERATPVACKPRDRFSDPVEISCTAELEHDRAISMPRRLPLAEQRREGPLGRARIGDARNRLKTRMIFGC